MTLWVWLLFLHITFVHSLVAGCWLGGSHIQHLEPVRLRPFLRGLCMGWGHIRIWSSVQSALLLASPLSAVPVNSIHASQAVWTVWASVVPPSCRGRQPARVVLRGQEAPPWSLISRISCFFFWLCCLWLLVLTGMAASGLLVRFFLSALSGTASFPLLFRSLEPLWREAVSFTACGSGGSTVLAAREQWGQPWEECHRPHCCYPNFAS